MKKIIWLTLLLTPGSILAQTKKIKTLEVSDTITFATVDRAGDLYFVLRDGQIQKFDRDGKLIVLYRHKGIPSLFDAGDGTSSMVYYRENQEYDYLSPSFEINASYRIDSAFAIEPWLITPSRDHKLWLLDKADNSLKKINVKESVVEIEVIIREENIAHVQQIKLLREYQNFVFMLDPHKGIFVYNTMGKPIKVVNAKGIKSFNFLGEELYYVKDGNINFLDLFTADTRTIPLQAKVDFALFSEGRLILVKDKVIDFFEYNGN